MYTLASLGRFTNFVCGSVRFGSEEVRTYVRFGSRFLKHQKNCILRLKELQLGIADQLLFKDTFVKYCRSIIGERYLCKVLQINFC